MQPERGWIKPDKPERFNVAIQRFLAIANEEKSEKAHQSIIPIETSQIEGFLPMYNPTYKDGRMMFVNEDAPQLDKSSFFEQGKANELNVWDKLTRCNPDTECDHRAYYCLGTEVPGGYLNPTASSSIKASDYSSVKAWEDLKKQYRTNWEASDNGMVSVSPR